MKSFANPRNLKTFREATVSNEKLWRASPNLLVSNGKILITIRALTRLTHPTETYKISHKYLCKLSGSLSLYFPAQFHPTTMIKAVSKKELTSPLCSPNIFNINSAIGLLKKDNIIPLFI